MGFNHSMTLSGKLEGRARVVEEDGIRFGVMDLATRHIFWDGHGGRHQLDTTHHQVFVFDLELLEVAEGLAPGTALKLYGHLFYRPFLALGEDGKTVRKKEAILVAHKMERKG